MNHLAKLVMNMVRSTKFSVTWNWVNLPKFVLSRGIWQGDPLSSYLLILCLEQLSIMLEEATRNRLIILIFFWRLVKYLICFFVDDIFLFTKVTHSCCLHFKDILDKFYSCLGQLISTPKSKKTSYLGTPIFTSIRQSGVRTNLLLIKLEIRLKDGKLCTYL